MSEMTKIEWTDATWNPVSGCSKVSEGCNNCYAEAMARRFDKGWKPWTAANAAHNVAMQPHKLKEPLHWRKPKRIFVCSMGDLFHEQVPDQFIEKVFEVMVQRNRHCYQVLTKRAERMSRWIEDYGRRIGFNMAGYAPNVWLGVTAENQRTADERIPLLLQTPAVLRFVSAEPLLGPINMVPYMGGRTYRCSCGFHETEGELVFLGGDDYRCHLCGEATTIGPAVRQVIVGGESGPKARPMHPAWPRAIRDQCQAAGVPFFFKQWGEYIALPKFRSYEEWVNKASTWVRRDDICLDLRGRICSLGRDFMRARDENAYPVALMRRVGKKAAGRELDGRTWDEIPERQEDK